MSRVTIAQLEAFYWTATLGSVEKAARRLNMSQPSISLRLKAIEAQIGSRLFDRVGRGISLSLNGHSILQDARDVLESVERINGRKTESDVRGTIRVGFAEGFALICLSPVLKRVHELYPDLHLEVSVSTTAFIEPDLLGRKLDLAFMVEPVEREGFTLVPLGAQEASWIAAESWNLPPVVTPHDIVDHPIISNPIGSINYKQILSWFGSAGLTPRHLDFCNSVGMLGHLVTTGVGIGIFPNKMADKDVREGCVRVLTTAPPIGDTPIFANFPKDGEDINIRAFVNTVREVLSEMEYLKSIGA
ncbi:LysR family transcriptional regulator [Mesorhizobium sp. A623]